MHTPRNYQPLHDEQARATSDAAPPIEQRKTAEETREQEPTRPTQTRASPPGWTDSGSMEAHFASANAYHNWANSDPSRRQEKLGDKAQLAADLKEARETTSANAQGRDQSRAPVADKTAAQPSASAREGTGKAALAADLKEAKENTQVQEKARDPSRSR